MSYQHGPSSHGQVLEKISREFSRFREEGGGYYSEELKAMAVLAIGQGLSRSDVAKAAEVSLGTIRNWLDKAPRAKRLNLVASLEAAGPTRTMADLICIRLASGVEIDFPRGELSVDFLEKLNCIGGTR